MSAGPEESNLPRGGVRPRLLRFATHLASNEVTVDFQGFVASELGRSLGLPVEFVVETSYESCLEDANDVCFVCGLSYVEFQRSGIDIAVPVAAPVLHGARYRGRPIYFSDVIVHRDSPWRRFIDLRGRSWAYNEPLSQSGYGIVRYHLARLGEVNGFFGAIIEVGFHREAVRMVAGREVDGAAIDCQVLSIEMRDHPELAERIRVVESLGPSTIQPVAVSWRIPSDLREAIRHALVVMGSQPTARERFAEALVDGFVAVDASDYDDIRAMVALCEEAGFLELR